MSVTSDSGPLIALSKLRLLHLLPALYREVLVPSPVFDEAVTRGVAGGHDDAGILEQAVARAELMMVDTHQDELLPAVRALSLGRGEQHAIHLALQRASDWLLVDDALAREAASALGLRVKGTLGILVQAFRARLLTVDQRDEVFEGLLRRDDIWLDESLTRRVWDELRRTN
ncbi:MAG TPA: hypothetical protein VHK90_08820 [Thermoanaerobaculia bacterium]|nr:hypothetical protein [Thermoanaerobaculia bacterium]